MNKERLIEALLKEGLVIDIKTRVVASHKLSMHEVNEIVQFGLPPQYHATARLAELAGKYDGSPTEFETKWQQIYWALNSAKHAPAGWVPKPRRAMIQADPGFAGFVLYVLEDA